MKIFFAGDTNKIKYASIKIRTFFDVMPRPQVIECITSEFAGRIKFLENESDKPEFEKILAAQGNTNDIVISQIKTKEENWLRILSKSDFFICPPGVFIPLCHNCIEAMSVGAIPILEYNDMFYPHLEHLVNCLQFSNADELQAVVEKALAMTQAEIDCMRKNVLNYYDEHLSVINIKNKIRAFSRSDQHQLKLAIPFVATEEEWKDYVKACRHLFGRWIVDE
jgi:hypothetical protein